MKFNISQIKPFLNNNVNSMVKKMCGDKLGEGAYRDVYILKQNVNYVVKIERDMSMANFANATEWRNYVNSEYWTWFNRWLAPCELINQTGQILIQKRVYWEGKTKKDYPKKVPVIFTDLKVENFGWLSDGDFVCCDYSFLLTPMTNKKMRVAKWKGKV